MRTGPGDSWSEEARWIGDTERDGKRRKRKEESKREIFVYGIRQWTAPG